MDWTLQVRGIVDLLFGGFVMNASDPDDMPVGELTSKTLPARGQCLMHFSATSKDGKSNST